MPWVIVESKSIYNMSSGATIWIRTTSGSATASINYRNSSTSHSISSNLPSGTRVQAQFTGKVDRKSVSESIELTVGTSNETGRTIYDVSSGSLTIDGTLYLKKWVTPNPPSAPTINIPTEIRGGEEFAISWSRISNATRYYLERSVNGSSFTIIYSGGSRSVTETALSTWSTVTYRVRAYNTDGYSGYRTSSTVTVKHFPEFYMKVNGELKTSENGWVKINGQLREIDTIWTKINGALREVE